MADELPPGITAEDVRRHKRLIARCWVVAGLLIELPLESLEQLSAQAETKGRPCIPASGGRMRKPSCKTGK